MTVWTKEGNPQKPSALEPVSAHLARSSPKIITPGCALYLSVDTSVVMQVPNTRTDSKRFGVFASLNQRRPYFEDKTR